MRRFERKGCFLAVIFYLFSLQIRLVGFKPSFPLYWHPFGIQKRIPSHLFRQSLLSPNGIGWDGIRVGYQYFLGYFCLPLAAE
ncbi:MAG: hypothetical protein NZ901_00515 [Geminocystis sp.]|nr:hypothetical protein [Geminocystis sp.]HIK38258.1 hypothetical protein [Geminocystis sp. M7585_C2015_104]MCS7146651.1 hypothetical protein [Geminocystis sp.]MCX8077200.1 hypothetical protein [Geminocystis sp.]MDW8115477.1 hypothetical protein [Geminocystis sp.]